MHERPPYQIAGKCARPKTEQEEAILDSGDIDSTLWLMHMVWKIKTPESPEDAGLNS